MYWVFDFSERKHSNVLNDMRERLAGDASEQWVRADLEERLAGHEELKPVGYKFLGA
ncbi:MAG TPA: hypothetical protein VKC66_01215 [Xanthobacteraceae bacterium]|nr:hypothetical protein [Xanthobacteraceae bacterium]